MGVFPLQLSSVSVILSPNLKIIKLNQVISGILVLGREFYLPIFADPSLSSNLYFILASGDAQLSCFTF